MHNLHIYDGGKALFSHPKTGGNSPTKQNMAPISYTGAVAFKTFVFIKSSASQMLFLTYGACFKLAVEFQFQGLSFRKNKKLLLLVLGLHPRKISSGMRARK